MIYLREWQAGIDILCKTPCHSPPFGRWYELRIAPHRSAPAVYHSLHFLLKRGARLSVILLWSFLALPRIVAKLRGVDGR